jgi:hypothetical protein
MFAQFSPAERAIFRRLKTPTQIQRFLDEEIAYNKEPEGPSCYSPRLVLRHRQAHCMEGAMFAAAALRRLGYPPLLVDLEAARDHDHVLAVYRRNGRWGSITKSNYVGLRGREPVYRTIRELAMSYFEHYFNPAGEKTLRTVSRAVSIARFDKQNWMTSEEPMWDIPGYLCEISHTRLLTPPVIRQLARVDRRLYEASHVGHVRSDGVAIRITPPLRRR